MSEDKKQGAGSLLLLKQEEKIITLLYQKNRLIRANISNPEKTVLHHIFIGKVKNVVQNIQSAFIEYAPGKLCHLPLKECTNPVVLNRTYDGRVVAGDELLIQIVSEPQKRKQAGASANLSFSGKYIVLTSGDKHVGYSAKLSRSIKEELKLWQKQSESFRKASESFGLVFRTNIRDLNDFKMLETELAQLMETAEQVMHAAPYRTCYSCLYQALPTYLKNLQDIYTSQYDKIVTDEKQIYEETLAYLTAYQKEDVSKLTFYEDALLPLSKLYSVETRLKEALDRKVWMKSGGYLMIDRTEALTCIDVNTGKYDGKKNKSEAVFFINMEAAKEIALQLQLRNISGIIIIDFINMDKEEQKKELMEYLKKQLAMDSIKTTVVDMTPLGLVEVTRKKEKKSLWEEFYEADLHE